jgi:hypothetical protein
MRLVLFSLLLLALAAAPIGFAEDDPADYRPVLVPLVSHGLHGAHGSVWDSELYVFNASQQLLRMLGATEDSPILPIEASVLVDPRETRQVVLTPREPGVDGAFLWVPNTHTGEAKFSLRVRDTSQNATSFGDEVPVVSAGQFAAEYLTLVDIPVDPKYRATLRIYGFTPAWMSVLVTIFREGSDVPLSVLELQVNGIMTTDYVPFLPHPAYRAIDPLTDAVRTAAAGGRVRIEIWNYSSITSPPPPGFWAFVSLTNNETNQVTIVTPK